MVEPLVETLFTQSAAADSNGSHKASRVHPRSPDFSLTPIFLPLECEQLFTHEDVDLSALTAIRDEGQLRAFV